MTVVMSEHNSTIQLATGVLKNMNCPEMRAFKEFRVCWPPIRDAIKLGKCIVYSFGVAKYDALTVGLAQAGCNVFAFDPGHKHTEHPWPNVTFRHYGLLSNINNEFSGIYGSTSQGKYVEFDAIRGEFGHSNTNITLMKIDCEGCEWTTFKRLYDNGQIERIDQVLTEMHFSETLRFSMNVSESLVPAFKRMMDENFNVFYDHANPGYYKDRNIPNKLLELGMPRKCCREISMLNKRLKIKSHAKHG